MGMIMRSMMGVHAFILHRWAWPNGHTDLGWRVCFRFRASAMG
jgi:hypothetical protein